LRSSSPTGIADGRGVAAALVLGAAGALIGTRFQASAEALVDPSISKAIVEGRGEDTERSTVLDIARGSRWPSKYPGRTLSHPFLDEWRGREDELAASSSSHFPEPSSWDVSGDHADPAGPGSSGGVTIIAGYLVIVSVSSVTAAVRASALPCTVTPVVMVIDARAMIFPRMVE
jgi:hypothetical protein